MTRRFLLPACLLLAACGGATIRHERDASVPIPAGATYAWGAPERRYAQENARLATDPEVHAMITAAMERELGTRGYRPADSAQATLLVHFHVGVNVRREETTDIVAAPTGVCASDWCRADYAWGTWGAPEVNYGVMEYREGALLVDVVDRASGKLAWRALYKTTITESAMTIAEREGRVNEAVRRTMASLPSAARP